MSRSVGIVGAAHTAFKRQELERSLEEMIFESVEDALADAELSLSGIDAVVMSTTDQVEGRIIESMVTNGAAGGVGRDVTTIASSGEHAFIYAVLRLVAAQGKRALVVVWSKQSESVDPRHADRLTAEPFLLRPVGVNSLTMAALQASALVSQGRVTPASAADLVKRRWQDVSQAFPADTDGLAEQAVSSEPVSWPLTNLDLPQPGDVAAALVLSADPADRAPRAWVSGLGWASDAYDPGSRDLTEFRSLDCALKSALGDSGAGGLDVVEIQEQSSYVGVALGEALGMATTRRGPVVNPSGGNLPFNPGNAAGFMRIVQAAQQLRGRAGAVQVDGSPRTAAAVAFNGFACQSASVVALSSERVSLKGVS